MKLTIPQAKALAKKYLLDSGIKEGEFYYAHTQGVVNAVRLLAERQGLDEGFFEAAAWVHDIGYFSNEKNHGQEGIKLLEKEGIEINAELKDCVLNHGNTGNPQTKVGKVMSIADKISIIDSDFLKVLLKGDIRDEEMHFMKMMFEKCIVKLEELR